MDSQRMERSATVALEAGTSCLTFDGATPSIKRDGSLLTEFDGRVEKAVLRALEHIDPGCTSISEESSSVDIYDAPPGFTGWVLDPIDGTTNFAAGFPVFAISLGYFTDGIPTFGAIWDSLTRRVYVSTQIERANYCVDIGDSYAAVDFEGDIDATAWGVSVFHDLASTNRSTRVIGSVALGMLWTSLGRFDLYCAPAPKIWDYAAGVAMVREAGGSVALRDLGLGRRSLVCGSPALVDQLLQRYER